MAHNNDPVTYRLQLSSILQATAQGPTLLSGQPRIPEDVRVDYPIETNPDGDFFIRVSTVLPPDLREAMQDNFITANQLQRAVIEARRLGAERQLAHFIDFLGLPARVIDVWPSTFEQLQERCVCLSAIMCVWAYVYFLVSDISSVRYYGESSAYGQRVLNLLRALLAPGSVTADSVALGMLPAALRESQVRNALRARVARQRGAALAMLISCREAQRQLLASQHQPPEQRVELLHQLNVQQQQQEIQQLRAQLTACHEQQQRTQSFYSNMLQRNCELSRTLLEQHEQLHTEYRQLSNRHQDLRRRFQRSHAALLQRYERQQREDEQQQELARREQQLWYQQLDPQQEQQPMQLQGDYAEVD